MTAVEREPQPRASISSPSTRSSTQRLALGLAIVALVAAIVGAIGPAQRVRTTYSWPPTSLPAGSPTSAWYTPLLLAAHRPESIDATIPCRLPTPLPKATSPTVVLATAHHPQTTNALAITRSGAVLSFTVGDNALTQFSVPSDTPDADCAYRLQMKDANWSIIGPSRDRRDGSLSQLPVVNGVFSGLDVRAQPAPAVEITTIPHAVVPSTRQHATWVISALSLVAALLIVSITRRPSLRRLGRRMRAAIANAHAADAVVAVVLLAWWILAPIEFDDGWLQAREQMYSSAHGLSFYYTVLGFNVPLGYWIEWANHWVAESTSALMLLRIPALLCLIVTWVTCRWVVKRMVTVQGVANPVVVWALAAAYLVGAVAWGMTLRPEPVIALLLVTAIASVVAFLQNGTVGPIAVAFVCVAVALPTHHTGVVVLAPLIVTAPRVLAWARNRVLAAMTIVVSSAALLVILLFVGTDYGQWRLETRLSTMYSLSWRDEFLRYGFLSVEPTATTIRRLAVGLLFLAVLAFVFRHRRAPAGLLDVPATVVAVALVLLVATPSKWPWHFGALVGAGAIAVAAETARIRAEAHRATTWKVWPLLAIATAAAVADWAWLGTPRWSPVDLRQLRWDLPFANTMSDMTFMAPLFLVIAALALVVFRRKNEPHAIPWRISSWVTPLLAVPPLVFTLGVLTADAAKTNGWTQTRQDLRTIAGRSGCGLADDLRVTIARSAQPLTRLGRPGKNEAARWVPPPPIPGLPRFSLSPVAAGRALTPWFNLPQDGRFGLFIAGSPAASDRLLLEWGRPGHTGVELVGTSTFADRLGGLPGTAPWRLLATGELPAADPQAVLVRVSYQPSARPGPALAVTAPVRYTDASLAPMMVGSASPALVYPDVLPYFPCTTLPRLENGAVEVPGLIITTDNGISVMARDTSSPFLGLLDLYPIQRLSIADTQPWPDKVFLFEVDNAIRGAGLVVPDSVTSTS